MSSSIEHTTERGSKYVHLYEENFYGVSFGLYRCSKGDCLAISIGEKILFFGLPYYHERKFEVFEVDGAPCWIDVRPNAVRINCCLGDSFKNRSEIATVIEDPVKVFAEVDVGKDERIFMFRNNFCTAINRTRRVLEPKHSDLPSTLTRIANFPAQGLKFTK